MKKEWGKYIANIMILFLLGCGNPDEAKVTIDKEYVINPNWDKVDNAFTVTKMKLKNGLVNLNLKEVTPSKLLQVLVKDSTFSYTSNIKYNGEKYSKRKIYFNGDNGFVWWDDQDINLSKKILGVLQTNTWYLLGGLSRVRTLYYVYIDPLGKIHSFEVSASYWTNF